MKTIAKYIWGGLLGGTLCLCSSCQKSEIPFYDSTHNALRFPEKLSDNKEPRGYDEETEQFRVTHSFVASPNVKSYDYNLPVELIGLVSDADRNIAYKIDAEKSKAPAGSYEVLKSVLPAGKRSGAITIRLFNPDVLKSEEYKLHITLIASDALAQGPSKYVNAVLSWSRRIPNPVHPEHIKTYNALIEGHETWNSSEDNYFSPNALRVIVDALGWYDWDDLKKHGSNGNGSRYYNYKYLPCLSALQRGTQYKAYALVIADYIKKYNAEHPDQPLLHDAGLNKGKPIQARKYNN